MSRDEDYRSEPDGSNGSFIGYKPHIEELEMLLEAYFVQIDGTLNKLSHVIYLHFPPLLILLLILLGLQARRQLMFSSSVVIALDQNC